MNGAATTQGWREERRLRASELKPQGWEQKDVARALGSTEGAVSLWVKRARTGGREALPHRQPPGRRPGLTAQQWACLLEILGRGAEAYQFRGDVWTTKRVAAVIRQEFGVRYGPAHVSGLLRACGWSVQKPVERAS